MEVTVLKWAIDTSVIGALIVMGYVISMIVRRLEKVEKDLSDTNTRVDKMKEELPYVFVLKEDWIRAQSQIETKLDRVLQAIVRLETKMEGEKK